MSISLVVFPSQSSPNHAKNHTDDSNDSILASEVNSSDETCTSDTCSSSSSTDSHSESSDHADPAYTLTPEYSLIVEAAYKLDITTFLSTNSREVAEHYGVKVS